MAKKNENQQIPPAADDQQGAGLANASAPAPSASPPDAGAPDNDSNAPPPPPPPDNKNAITVSLRHKTEYQHYRRAGLMLTKTAVSHEVTPEQLAVLKADKWVEVVEK